MGLYHDFCYSPVPPQKSFRMILARASVLYSYLGKEAREANVAQACSIGSHSSHSS